MDKQTDLLRQVKDEYAKHLGYDDWDSINWYQLDYSLGNTCEPYAYDKAVDEVAQRYAEAYHAAKLQEGKTNLLRLMQLADHILSMDKHMANQFQGNDYRQMWEIWRGVADKVIKIEENLKRAK